ncbi:MAG: triacylglycerol lipase [Streptococcaceae bacterium]|nr:triacylglycerol lipase [Streptococcaceae bacterium]
MKIIKRSIYLVLLILATNQLILWPGVTIPTSLKVLTSLFLSAFFIFYLVNPLVTKEARPDLLSLSRAHVTLFTAAILFLTEILIYSGIAVLGIRINPWLLGINAALSLILSYLMAISGLIRAFMTSKQLSLTFRLLMIFAWWFPGINIVFAFLVSRSMGQELIFNREKYFLNERRKSQQICATRYPIVMVHGIFFRDWELFNYWGRIPAELEKNGAVIFYGGHASSLPVEVSAEELKKRILSVLLETGADKVNIIAHSKGGIDSRYAISQLGLAENVASLTTINTPHFGSDLAGTMLEMAPKKVVTTVGKEYSKIFRRLGDADVDFVGSVSELTATRCLELNQQMPDSDLVYYQSAGSQMKNWKSAAFPLNIGYSIIKATGGDNDGLVATRSMKWGNFLGIQQPAGKKGISHGDMIDLTRKNLPGFDVTEFYVKLVSDLKKHGF